MGKVIGSEVCTKGAVAKYLQQPLKTFPHGEGGSRSETDEGPYGTGRSDKAFIEPLCHPTPLFHHRFAAVPGLLQNRPKWVKMLKKDVIANQ